MKKYTLSRTENELNLEFYFNKNSVWPGVALSLFPLFLFIFFAKPGRLADSWGSLLFLTGLLFYATSQDYFEWRKHRVQSLEKGDNEDLFINGVKKYKVFNIKQVEVVYNNASWSVGYKVYLIGQYSTVDYCIKERLTRKDANAIALEIADFLGTEAVLNTSIW